jgi:quaternary ammonium compound-resistance protein SugE
VAWIMLIAAGMLEIAWALAMKQSDGLTRLGPTAITLLAMLGSVWLLSLSMKSLPLGTAYPMWTGIGAVGTFIVGITVLDEQATAGRILAAALIVAGLVLMNASSD